MSHRENSTFHSAIESTANDWGNVVSTQTLFGSKLVLFNVFFKMVDLLKAELGTATFF